MSPAQGTPTTGLSRRAVMAVAAVALTYTAVYSFLTLWRHALYNSSMYDLGLFDQLIWNMSHGRFFESSIKGFNYLGDHCSPVLALFAPLYWIWDDVRLLLIFQSAAIAASAFPFAAVAAEVLGNEAAAVIMAAVFLLQPNLGYVNIFDFHPEILLVPAFTFAMYFARKGRPWAAVACALFALTVKEDVAVTAACFAAYLFFTSSRPAGAVLFCVSAAWFGVAMNVIIPANRPTGAVTGYLYMERYAHLGTSLPEVVQNAVLHPITALAGSYDRWKAVTFFRMFLPTGFLAFAGLPVLLVAAPVMGYSYISAYLPQFDVRFQYLTIAVPFIMYAALDGARRTVDLLDRAGARRGSARFRRPVLVWAVPAVLAGLNLFSVYWIVHSQLQINTFKAPYNLAEIKEAVARFGRAVRSCLPSKQ